MLQNGYGILTNDVLFDKKLSSTGKLVFVFITSLSAEKGFCWASNKYIAEKMSIGLSTASGIISDLEKAGYVSVEVDKVAGNRRKIRIGILENQQTYTEKPVDPYTEKPVHNSIRVNSISKNYNLITPESLELTKILANCLVQNFEFMAGKLTVDIQTKWARDIEKLHRIDGYDYKLIQAVLEWSQQDDFWKQNIRSGATLRKQFTQLLIRIKSQPKTVEFIS